MSGEQQEKQDIGRRVRDAMKAHRPGARQADVAAELGMTPDAYSRSLGGDRAFSSAELARAAHLFHADIHLLITGEPDPMRAVVAARHSFDQETFEYRNDGHAQDQVVRDGVILAYQQADPWLSTSAVELPDNAAQVRALLGDDFARQFADRVEERLGVDVVRLPGLTTAYSITVAGQRVVLLHTDANWFYSNWSLAHELGHLCLGHHEADATRSSGEAESRANAFAAELLLPAAMMRSLDWATLTADETAQFIWDTGVSTSTLRNRLNTLSLTPTVDVADGLTQSTQRFLNRHLLATTKTRTVEGFGSRLTTVVDPIGGRMRDAAERRVPARLMKALRDGITDGRLNTGTLAWLLEVDPESLEVDEPDHDEELSADTVAAMLGL